MNRDFASAVQVDSLLGAHITHQHAYAFGGGEELLPLRGRDLAIFVNFDRFVTHDAITDLPGQGLRHPIRVLGAVAKDNNLRARSFQERAYLPA